MPGVCEGFGEHEYLEWCGEVVAAHRGAKTCGIKMATLDIVQL